MEFSILNGLQYLYLYGVPFTFTKKADRTAYDAWYSCRTRIEKCNIWNSHGHVAVLRMAIPHAEI